MIARDCMLEHINLNKTNEVDAELLLQAAR